MIKVYANLVLNGLKTLEEVPIKFRAAVEEYINQILDKKEEDMV
jgi:hypothetical protein